jgi:hypothetical protein
MFRVTDTPRLIAGLALLGAALLLAACGVMADQPATLESTPTESQPAEAAAPESEEPAPTPEEAPAEDAGADADAKSADEPPEAEPPEGESQIGALDSSTGGAAEEPAKVDCPGALAPRLTVGEPGRVTFSNGLSVRVREEPSTDESVTVLFMLPEGTVFTVIGGPECAENWLWWEIEMANGVSGWASEGSPGEGYFLEPYNP